MQHDFAPGKNRHAALQMMRAAGSAIALSLLLLTCGFTSGALWNHRQAQGTPAHGRQILPGADEVLGKQIMFRMYEDAAQTIAMLQEMERNEGWRCEQAQLYMGHLRKRLR